MSPAVLDMLWRNRPLDSNCMALLKSPKSESEDFELTAEKSKILVGDPHDFRLHDPFVRANEGKSLIKVDGKDRQCPLSVSRENDPPPPLRSTRKFHKKLNKDGNWYAQMLNKYHGVQITQEQEINVTASILKAGNPDYTVKRLRKWYGKKDALTNRMGDSPSVRRASSLRLKGFRKWVDPGLSPRSSRSFSKVIGTVKSIKKETKEVIWVDLTQDDPGQRDGDHTESLRAGYLKQKTRVRRDFATVTTKVKSDQESGDKAPVHSSVEVTTFMRPSAVNAIDESLLQSLDKVPKTWEELLEWIEPHDKALDNLLRLGESLRAQRNYRPRS